MGLGENKRSEMANELNSLLRPGEKIVMFGGCTARVDRLGTTVTRQATAERGFQSLAQGDVERHLKLKGWSVL